MWYDLDIEEMLAICNASSYGEKYQGEEEVLRDRRVCKTRRQHCDLIAG